MSIFLDHNFRPQFQFKNVTCNIYDFPSHHHNGFVTTCRLWTASGGVHALLVLEQIKCSTSTRLGKSLCVITYVTYTYLLISIIWYNSIIKCNMIYCNTMKTVTLYNDMYISYLNYILYVLCRVFYILLYYTIL